MLLLVAAMHSRHVVHFDLKADNVLMRQQPGSSESGVSLLLGDFGEAMVLGQGSAAALRQSRGTECVQAPEMLLAGKFFRHWHAAGGVLENGNVMCACCVTLTLVLGSQHADSKHDRRKPVSASYSADVWSVGCLFYELLFGEFLFADPDWTQFFVRVTKDILPIASDSAAAAMAPYPLVSSFLSYILVRNSNMRPTIHEVILKFDTMFGSIMQQPLPATLSVAIPAQDIATGASGWPLSAPSSVERAAFYRSLIPIDLAGSWVGKLNICCWPPPPQAAALNFYCVVTTDSLFLQHSGCHHMRVNLESLLPFSSPPTPDRIAAFRSIVNPCLDALLACMQQGGSCAICSSRGAGCSDVVTVAASLLCSRGLSLLQALRLLRQAVVIQTPPPAALDLIHFAYQSGSAQPHR